MEPDAIQEIVKKCLLNQFQMIQQVQDGNSDSDYQKLNYLTEKIARLIESAGTAGLFNRPDCGKTRETDQ